MNLTGYSDGKYTSGYRQRQCNKYWKFSIIVINLDTTKPNINILSPQIILNSSYTSLDVTILHQILIYKLAGSMIQ